MPCNFSTCIRRVTAKYPRQSTPEVKDGKGEIMGNHVTLYEGPNVEGKDIVVLACMGSDNVKTSNVVTLNVLSQEMTPSEAVKAGLDSVICGNCSKRPKHYQARYQMQLAKLRSLGMTKAKANRKVRDEGLAGTPCYVTKIHGPRAAYKEWQDGNAPAIKPADFIAEMRFRGLTEFRNAGYGDSAMVPKQALLPFLSAVRAVGYANIGYTEQWFAKRAQWLRSFCMASVDNEKQRDMAQAMGWLTFRAIQPGEAIADNEAHCGASAEMGHAMTCVGCVRETGGCAPYLGGSSRVIMDHGGGSLVRRLQTNGRRAKLARTDIASQLMAIHNERLAMA